MKILFAACEAMPFIMTGGLGDVAGALPKALNHNKGIECRVILPLYGEIPDALRSDMKFLTSFSISVAWRTQYCGIFAAKAGGVTYYLIDNEYYFKRTGVYGHYDDAERFSFFSRAVLETVLHIDFKPDIIHANDWHSAMIPVFFKAYYENLDAFRATKTVFTIHNIQYQGKYDSGVFTDILGLPEKYLPVLKFEDCVNFMKGAIEQADAVTTVSPSYAHELCYPFYAYGLQDIISRNSAKFSGILNGIDTELYDPATDRDLFKCFSADSLEDKAVNKSSLQKLVGLPADKDALVIGMVTRLVSHKGVDLVKFVLEEMMTDHVQLVMLGKGDFLYENYFSEMSRRYPGKLSVTIGFVQDLAHKIYAGSDVLLMPSQTEPCGLAQMVALRYGTVPIVRETGGLKDSITDNGEDNHGNGYTFKSINAHDMLGTVRRAEGAFVQKDYWEVLVRRAIGCDFSWKRSAGEYLRLYGSLTGKTA
jgi:starch synthase